MKKIFFYQIILLFIAIDIEAQTFQKTFGTSGKDYSTDVIQTSDKGYAVLGVMNGLGAYLLKTDSLGIKQWSKKIAIETFWPSTLGTISQTMDNGFIFSGTINYSNSNYSIVIKTDALGNVEWSKMHEALSSITSIKQTLEGDYIAVGLQYSGSKSTLIRFNASGDIIRSRTLPISSYFKDVLQLKSDSSFVTYYCSSSASQNIIISRFSKTMNLMWSKIITSPSVNPGFDCGHIYENGNDLQIGLNVSGSLGILSVNKNVTSAKFIGTSNKLYNYSISDAIPAANKGVVIAAEYNTSQLGYETQALLISLDSLGGFIWAKQIGGLKNEGAKSIKQTKDKGFIIAGYTNSFSVGNSDIYLIKTDSLGESGCHNSPIKITTSTTSLNANLADYTGAVDSLFNNITTIQNANILNTSEVMNDACICIPPTASFAANPMGIMQDDSSWADKWYWTISGTSGIDSTTKYKNYIGIPNGTYTVCLKVKNSCGVDSTCQQLNYVYYPINVQENSKNIISNVYPNPFRDKLIISCERINANTNPIQIKVMNSLGLLVYSDKMEGTQKEIQLPELASGLYFIQFTLNEIVVIRKLIKE